jgi:hypothetical protein
MMNNTDGWMGGWMGGQMSIWVVLAVLAVLILSRLGIESFPSLNQD